MKMATLGGLDCLNNRRQLGRIGNTPPAKAEENVYAQRDVLNVLAGWSRGGREK